MLYKQVAVVSEVPSIDFSEVSQVAAALQRQVIRDFAPIWQIDAIVSAFARLEDVPLGYWPVIVILDVKNAAGVHLDKDGQPFGLIDAGPGWSLTASHEVLEMLADPFGDRLASAPSIMDGQGRVEYLVEVCDPSEDEQYGYTVNGFLVSDFYTPDYFLPVAASNVRYSFTGAITSPREVLLNGYVSWHDPLTDHWFQCKRFGQVQFVDLGVFDRASGESARTFTNSRTTEVREFIRPKPDGKPLKAAALSGQSISRPSGAKAASLRQRIQEIKARSKTGPA